MLEGFRYGFSYGGCSKEKKTVPPLVVASEESADACALFKRFNWEATKYLRHFCRVTSDSDVTLATWSDILLLCFSVLPFPTTGSLSEVLLFVQLHLLRGRAPLQ